MKRLTHDALVRLGDDLGEEARTVLEVVDRLQLVSHAQLASLLTIDSLSDAASEASRARLIRRRLQRLHDFGLVGRLERRVGGVRAGSAGHIYHLNSAGQRLLAYWQGRGLVRGRGRPEPGGRYVRHRLSVSQLYVDLQVAEAASELELLRFEPEPDCWRTHELGFGEGLVIKPDAFVALGVGAYEERAFVEVDLATESRPVIARKLKTYIAYYHSGQEQAVHGVFPRVVLLTNSETRKAALVKVCADLPPEDWQLFSVGLLSDAVEHLLGDADRRGEQEAEALA